MEKIKRDNNLIMDSDSEIDAVKLFGLLLAKLWLVLIFALFFGVLLHIYSKSLPDKYTSSALLVSSSDSSASAIANLSGKLGALASFAGVGSASTGAQDKTVIAVKLLDTWGFLEKVIYDNNLEHLLYGVKGWNKQDNKILFDDGYESLSNKMIPGFKPINQPTSWELFLKLKEIMDISEDKASGIIELSVTHVSPYAAKHIVDILIREINKHMQSRDREVALASIKYLEDKAQNTKIEEMRNIFFALIEEQTKNLMLAEINQEYVLKTISEARVPDQKSGPRRSLFVLAGVFLGALIGFFMALILCIRKIKFLDFHKSLSN